MLILQLNDNSIIEHHTAITQIPQVGTFNNFYPTIFK